MDGREPASRETTIEPEKAGNFEKNARIAKKFLWSFLALLTGYIVVFSLVYGISDFLVILGLSMFFIGPTYFANAMMVFTSNGKPIDRGKNFIDGKRLFGETKTIGGFLGGMISGFLLGLLIGVIFFFSHDAIQAYAITQLDYLHYITLDFLGQFLHPEGFMLFIRAFFCGLGAPIGDLTGSFLKRRFGKKSGKPFWFVDQLDFIIVTILICLPWFPFDIYLIILLLILTPSITLVANNVAYAIGKKHEPW